MLNNENTWTWVVKHHTPRSIAGLGPRGGIAGGEKFVGTWMNLENVILSKLTQEQKMKHRIFSLIGG